jgi:hypothetical protein
MVLKQTLTQQTLTEKLRLTVTFDQAKICMDINASNREA